MCINVTLFSMKKYQLIRIVIHVLGFIFIQCNQFSYMKLFGSCFSLILLLIQNALPIEYRTRCFTAPSLMSIVYSAMIQLFIFRSLPKFVFLFSFLLLIPGFPAHPPFSFSSQSRRLITFFILNFLFMFVEFVVGFSTNSLGLISDAFHMLADNLSLFISVVASLINKWPQNARFSYGFERIQIICSYSNTILLFFISFNLLSESFSRFISVPEIGQDNLILVSVLGLIVNLLGLYFIGGDEPPTANNEKDKCVFLKTIYLHVIVDALGSVAVILSSIIVVYFHVYLIDTVCSFLIALSIFFTTIPLIKKSNSVLMQATNEDELNNVLSHCGCVSRFNVWELSENVNILTSTIICDVQTNLNMQLESIIRILNENGIRNMCIELKMQSETTEGGIL